MIGLSLVAVASLSGWLIGRLARRVTVLEARVRILERAALPPSFEISTRPPGLGMLRARDGGITARGC